jgi:hypothetical protein
MITTAYSNPLYRVNHVDVAEAIDEMEMRFSVRSVADWPRPSYVDAEPYTPSEIRCARIARCIVATWDAVERNWEGRLDIPSGITSDIRLTAKVFDVMVDGFARNAQDRKELFRRLRNLRTAKPE